MVADEVVVSVAAEVVVLEAAAAQVVVTPVGVEAEAAEQVAEVLSLIHISEPTRPY